MHKAAELKIDNTPAEGFSNEVVDEVLGLKELGLKSVSLLYLGYRDEANDWLSTMKKVRIPMDEFIIKSNTFIESFVLSNYGKSKTPKLENQICFPLYVIAKEITGLYRPFFLMNWALPIRNIL